VPELKREALLKIQTERAETRGSTGCGVLERGVV
jgi:hypothetical protein